MPSSRIRAVFETLFPSSDGTIERSQLVQQSLRSLRMVRDQQTLVMGSTKRIPSRYELRLSPEQFDQLQAMHALRDLEIFLADQLMKDSASGGMRTFGDHLLRVAIACDDTLTSGELYTATLPPEIRPPAASPLASPAAHPAHDDSTRVLGAPDSAIPPAPFPQALPAVWRAIVEGDGGAIANVELTQGTWIIGRYGNSGTPLPEQCRKIDLDVRPTVSRQQLRVEVLEDSIVVEQIGKGRMWLAENDHFRPGFPRTLLPGSLIHVEEYTIRFVR